MLSEAMVRHIVGQEGAEILLGVVNDAWQDYLDERRPRFHRSTRAHVVWDHMVLRSDTAMEDMDGVRRELRQERPLYVLREKLALRPKMHDRDSLTRNYPTKAQQTVVRTGLFDEYAYQNIMFGYRLDAAEAGIEQVLITSATDTWVIDLNGLAQGDLEPATPMFDMPDYDKEWRMVEPIRRYTGDAR